MPIIRLLRPSLPEDPAGWNLARLKVLLNNSKRQSGRLCEFSFRDCPFPPPQLFFLTQNPKTVTKVNMKVRYTSPAHRMHWILSYFTQIKLGTMLCYVIAVRNVNVIVFQVIWMLLRPEQITCYVMLWSIVVYTRGFKSFEVTGANQGLSFPTHFRQRLAMRQISSNSDSNIAKIQLSKSKLIPFQFSVNLGLTKSRIKFLASVIFW